MRYLIAVLAFVLIASCAYTQTATPTLRPFRDTARLQGNLIVQPGAAVPTPTPYFQVIKADGTPQITVSESGVTINDLSGLGSSTVNGPGSSTDNAVVRWNGVAGETLQNSSVLISDGGYLTVGAGYVYIGADDSVGGVGKFYGSNALGGSVGGQAWFYNSTDDDSSVDYWRFYANGTTLNIGPDTDTDAFQFESDGDLGIAGSLTTTLYATIGGGALTVGAEDVVPGVLYLRGGIGNLDGTIQIGCADDEDSVVDYWQLQAQGTTSWFGPDTDTDAFRFDSDGTFHALTLATTWEKVKVVAKSGGDYSSINSAISALSGSVTAASPGTVIVMPGTYTETIALAPQVHLVSIVPRAATIYQNASNQLTLSGGVTIEGFVFKREDAAAPFYTAGAVNLDDLIVLDCVLIGKNGAADVVYLTSCTGRVIFDRCEFQGDVSGVTLTTCDLDLIVRNSIFSSEGSGAVDCLKTQTNDTSNVMIQSCSFYADTTGTGASGVINIDQLSDSNIVISNSTLHIDNGSSTYTSACILQNSAGAVCTLNNSHLLAETDVTTVYDVRWAASGGTVNDNGSNVTTTTGTGTLNYEQVVVGGEIADDTVDGDNLADTVALDAPLALNGNAVSGDGNWTLGDAAGDSHTVNGSLVVDTSLFKVDAANDRIGIGTASPPDFITIKGTDTSWINFYRFPGAGGNVGGMAFYENNEMVGRIYDIDGTANDSEGALDLYDDGVLVIRLRTAYNGSYFNNDVEFNDNLTLPLQTESTGTDDGNIRWNTTNSPGALQVYDSDTPAWIDIGPAACPYYLVAAGTRNASGWLEYRFGDSFLEEQNSYSKRGWDVFTIPTDATYIILCSESGESLYVDQIRPTLEAVYYNNSTGQVATQTSAALQWNDTRLYKRGRNEDGSPRFWFDPVPQGVKTRLASEDGVVARMPGNGSVMLLIDLTDAKASLTPGYSEISMSICGWYSKE